MTRLLFFSLFLAATFYLLSTLSPIPALAQGESPNSFSSGWTTPSLLDDAKEIQKCDQEPCLSARTYSWWSWSNTLKDTLLTIDFPLVDSTGNVVGHSGILPTLANLTGSLYTNPPASTTEYIAYVSQNLGLAKPAYAQTVGQRALGPVLEIWKTFRDGTYVIFVLIFIILGFMVMFRRKIDPQTVIGIQQALPSIVVALLLITFSYAIVGFMVDLMQLSTNLIVSLVRNQLTNLLPGEVSKLYDENIFNIIAPIAKSEILAEIVGRTISFPNLGSVLEQAPKFIGNVGVWVIFGLAGFFITFKIFFMLLSAYVAIVLNTILAPLRLLSVAIPGSNGVGNWFKDLLSNIFVFPTTFILVLLAAVFQASAATATGKAIDFGEWQINQAAISEFNWAPPLIGTKWGAAMGSLIAYGILFAIPTINKQIQQILEVKPGLGGEAAMQEIKENIARTPFIGSALSRIT